MKQAIVLSIPHSGTHFTMFLINEILGGHASFGHFEESAEGVVRNRLINFDPLTETVIIPYRPEPDIKVSWMNRQGADGADWWAKRLHEYQKCWDVKDRATELLNNTGFLLLPIDKSPMRFQHVANLKRALGMDDRVGLPSENEFVAKWPRVRSWDQEAGAYRDDNLLPNRREIMRKLERKDNGT